MARRKTELSHVIYLDHCFSAGKKMTWKEMAAELGLVWNPGIYRYLRHIKDYWLNKKLYLGVYALNTGSPERVYGIHADLPATIMVQNLPQIVGRWRGVFAMNMELLHQNLNKALEGRPADVKMLQQVNIRQIDKQMGILTMTVEAVAENLYTEARNEL